VHEGSDCLRPGQFLQVRLRVSGGEQRYRVPQNAVARSREATLVFVHAPFGFFATEVKMVGQDNGHAIITGELRGDESVALSGLAAIKAAWMGLGGGE